MHNDGLLRKVWNVRNVHRALEHVERSALLQGLLWEPSEHVKRAAQILEGSQLDCTAKRSAPKRKPWQADLPEA